MQLIKIAAAVLNQTPLAWDSNREHIAQAISAAKEQSVGLLCLPELCITGYGCEDAFHSPGVWRMAWRVLQELLPLGRGMVVSYGMPLAHGGALFNTACLAADGRVLGFTAKRFLAGDGIHYEPRWFKPWPVGERAEVELDDIDYPLGDLSFECGNVHVGFEICEDAWVANRPGAELARRGCDIILNPSASHFSFGKRDVRRRFVLEGSRAFGVSYVYANLLGNEAGRAIYDGGAMIASTGRMLAEGPRFSFADWSLTTAVVDIESTRMTQARTASFRPELRTAGSLRLECDFDFPPVAPERAVHESAEWENGSHVKEEEFSRAESLALFDYLRKSHSRGFVVSLSGGADSSAVACLCGMLVRLGCRELGLPAFKQRLAHVASLADADNEDTLIRHLLACVYQSTRNSGPVTLDAAQRVADAVGAEFLHFDVDAQVQGYTATVSQAIGRPLDWKQDDIALQNIQARARSPGVWMLANLRHALLLATSNRSEAAVGYCTMDGDTSGSISPIAGIDKHFLRQWLRWMETDGPAGIGPLPALAVVNRQAPTAELRPPAASQTDEADLMPYDLLDAIERAAIRDKHMPWEVFQLVSIDYPQYTWQQLLAWVERFFRLWCRNQWKRERYAPSFHLDDENLDPKTWCRFPILSGGFDRELEEMKRKAEGERRKAKE
ncbi:MAG: NAD(+) synthase [Pirellulales bacterium]